MSYPDLQIDWLRAFVTVVDTGSLSAAAPLIHRSQSAVSMQIKKLEGALGRPVLSRGPRHLTLTPTGRELLSYARRMLDLHTETQSALLGPQLAGRIRLGVPDDYAGTYLTPVLRRFSNQYPSVEIDLRCEQSTALIPLVERDKLDLALISQDKSARGEHLFDEPLVWVGDPQFELWRRAPLPIAVYETGSMVRNETLRALDNVGRPYRVVYHSASLIGQLAAVESGIALAVLTRCSVPTHLQSLINLPVEFELPVLSDMRVGLIRGKATIGIPAVDALYQQMKQMLCI